VKPPRTDRHEGGQEKPYLRKIELFWVLSGGRHLGMGGYHSWREGMDEVFDLPRRLRSVKGSR